MSTTVSPLINKCATAEMPHRLAMEVMMVGYFDWTKVGITKTHYRKKHLDPSLGFRRLVLAVFIARKISMSRVRIGLLGRRSYSPHERFPIWADGLRMDERARKPWF